MMSILLLTRRRIHSVANAGNRGGIGQNSGQDAGQKKIAAPAFWSSV